MQSSNRSFHSNRLILSRGGAVCMKIVLITLPLCLVACAEDSDELKQKVAEIRAKPGEHIDPVPEIKPYEAFKYEAGAERSPFVASMSTKSVPSSSTRPDIKRKREFLEQVPLDTLQMVGCLQQQGITYGLLRDRNGLVHRVQIGNYVGQSDGRVASITNTKMTVIELVNDGLGGYTERPVTLTVKE